MRSLFNVTINNRQRGVLGYEAHIGTLIIKSAYRILWTGQPMGAQVNATRDQQELATNWLVGPTLCPELQGTVNHTLSEGSLSVLHDVFQYLLRFPIIFHVG